MTWVYLDAETAPDQTRGPDPNSVKPPKNYKDLEKIREYKLEHALQEWKDTALNRWKCHVICAGVITDEMTEPLIWMALSERDVLAGMAAWFDHAFPENSHPNAPEPIWCGHNSVSFDLPILSLRAFRYGFTRLGRELRPGHPKWGDPRHKDTLLAAGGEGKLEDLATFFNITRKKTIGGGEIGDAWMRQQFQQIADHLADDILTQRSVAKKMRDMGIL